jgi:hypothetical protein
MKRREHAHAEACMTVVFRVRRTLCMSGIACMCTNEVLAAFLLFIWVMQDHRVNVSSVRLP